jgi:mono/diheme cytochrome c family protein
VITRRVDRTAEDPLTEIPEHLLERSRARRAALGLGGGGAAPAKTESGEEAPAAGTPTAVAPARAAAAPAAVAAPKVPEVVLSPYAQAAIARKKIPYWAVPVLIFLPLWGFLYWGTLDPEPVKETGILAEGATVYARCASCHGANGGGGVGPALTTVHDTFPNVADQVWWVTNGSKAVSTGSPYGSPTRPGGQRVSVGGMPDWGNGLTAQQLLSVVYYERVHFGGEDPTKLAAIEAIAKDPKLPAHFTEGTTAQEIADLLASLTPAGTAAES